MKRSETHTHTALDTWSWKDLNVTVERQPAWVCVLCYSVSELYLLADLFVCVCMNFYASGVVNYLGAMPLWKIGNGLKGEKKMWGKKFEEEGVSFKDFVTWSFEGD